MQLGVEEILLVEEPLEIDDWRGPLDCLKFQRTQIENGAPMMKALAAGIKWVRTNTKIEEQNDLVVPGVMFTRGTDSQYDIPNPFCYDTTKNNVRVDIDHLLQTASLFKPNEIASFRSSPAGEITFYGAASHYFTLNGAHEAEHARWDQFESMPIQRGLRPKYVSRPEYDAQPWELAAKKTEKAVAKHFGMRDETKGIIQRDIDDAEELIERRKQESERYWQEHWTNWRVFKWLRG